MMNKKTSLILALLLLLTITGCGKRVGTSEDTLIIGLDDSYVPMGFTNKKGQLEGFDIDLAKAAGKEMHRKIVFQPIDWSMKETELRNGTIDLIWNGYSKTPQRAEKVAFSHPYLQNNQVIVVKKNSHINNVQDLRGKSVGTQSGSAGYTKMMEEPKLLKDFIKHQTPVQYDNIEQGMLDLNAGRIQGFLFDQVFAEYYVAHSPHPNQYQIVKTPFAQEQFVVGLRKNDFQTKQQLNAAITKLRQNGELKRIYDKWFQ